MRIICDVCESAAATLFCAADEAALCRPCDDKVHKCNKLASRHVRVVLSDPSEVSRCDICEVSPAFFYCEIDGSSLCLQCDTIVHVGGKRTHSRYLLLRQRVENKYQPGNHVDHEHSPHLMVGVQQQNHEVSPTALMSNNKNNENADSIMIDLNKRPSRNRGQASSTQGGSSSTTARGVVPLETLKERC